MIIVVDPSGSPVLSEVDDLKRFMITGTRPSGSGVVRLTAAGVELSDDAQHGFIDPATVLTWAHELGSLPDDWQAGFDAMVAYATSKGWVDAQGRLRAHSEWTLTEPTA